MRRERGFTLIEIVVAIVLLATAFTIILGLQSSVVNQAVRDRNRELALLAGRRIMARIEVEEEDLVETDESKPLLRMLASFEPETEDSTERKRDEETLKNFQANLNVSSVGIPDVDEKAMKRVALTISWSEGPLDQVTLVYFMPTADS